MIFPCTGWGGGRIVIAQGRRKKMSGGRELPLPTAAVFASSLEKTGFLRSRFDRSGVSLAAPLLCKPLREAVAALDQSIRVFPFQQEVGRAGMVVSLRLGDHARVDQLLLELRDHRGQDIQVADQRELLLQLDGVDARRHEVRVADSQLQTVHDKGCRFRAGLDPTRAHNPERQF